MNDGNEATLCNANFIPESYVFGRIGQYLLLYVYTVYTLFSHTLSLYICITLAIYTFILTYLCHVIYLHYVMVLGLNTYILQYLQCIYGGFCSKVSLIVSHKHLTKDMFFSLLLFKG